MVDQLSSFAAEVTRVAREVGTEGRLGGQAQVRGVSGTWKDLTDNVNFMAGNLTGQVRGIAKVVTAVADGDLKQKLTVEAKGEIAALAETINSMTDTLATFADQVTTVAREVGVEGKLGGQAKVPGAAGTWKGLTENVNQLAANLTTQVRAIAEVATAVTQGDLTRSITVKAQGEVAALKDTINEMIRNLKDTTQKNTEQDWLKTNLAKFSRMLQGQKDLVTVGQLILSELAPVVGAQQAEFYVLTTASGVPTLKLFASYASGGQQVHGKEIALGQGLVGQCAIEKQKILLTNVAGSAFRVATGLSEGAALDVLVLPVVFEGEVRGVLELASLERFNPAHQAFLDQLTESIGIVINTIAANMRTEDLLTQSQSLAEELQSRQQELQTTNEELQEKARLLAHQNQEVERKNTEVEQARQALEEKAEQLALTSKYKSEFLANMSHELRTPLNSLLILSDQLCKNAEGNLTARQVEFAKTIHLSGNDLLMLINDILDLSKIESGTVAVDVSELRMDDLQRSVERSFRHVAESKHVDFFINAAQPLPKSIVTDVKRLQQIIKNLLSNAFKFTHRGQVTLDIGVVESGWSPDNEELNRAGQVIAFAVSDTGIGISADKQQIIFEAFQQADGSTSRKYGGTGLGLAISRELSRLLGGEIRLVSTPTRGSTFTLYLPQSYSPARSARHARAPAHEAEAKGQAERSLEIDPRAEARTVRLWAASDMQPLDEEAQDAGQRPVHQPRRRRSQRDHVGRQGAADRRERSRLREAAARGGAPQRLQGARQHSGAGALALTREYHPSVITLDIFLPDMEGWRILERLKARPVDAAHPGLRGVDRRFAPARAEFRRHRLPGETAAVGRCRRRSARAPVPLRRSQREEAAGDDARLAVAQPDTSSAWTARRTSCWPTRVGAARAAARRRRRRLPDHRRHGGRLRPRGRDRDDGAPPAGEPVADRALQRRRRQRRDAVGGAATARSRCARRRSLEHLLDCDRVLPAPRHRGDVGAGTPVGAGAARRGPRARGQEGAHRRRRHAQHLRAGDRARRAGHGDRLGRQRPRCDPARARTTRASTSC